MLLTRPLLLVLLIFLLPGMLGRSCALANTSSFLE